jgi:predicted Zn-dependent protease
MSAAVLEYRLALADTPDSVPLLNRLSSSLMAMNKEREALEFLERAREISPDHPTSYTLLGQVYLETGDGKKAKEAFQESVQINPFNPGVHLGLARAYEKLGDQTSALREREIARKLMQ